MPKVTELVRGKAETEPQLCLTSLLVPLTFASSGQASGNLLWKYQNLAFQKINFKTSSNEEEEMELEDDTMSEPNLILAYVPLTKLCKRPESNKELCPVCLGINQTR